MEDNNKEDLKVGVVGLPAHDVSALTASVQSMLARTEGIKATVAMSYDHYHDMIKPIENDIDDLIDIKFDPDVKMPVILHDPHIGYALEYSKAMAALSKAEYAMIPIQWDKEPPHGIQYELSDFRKQLHIASTHAESFANRSLINYIDTSFSDTFSITDMRKQNDAYLYENWGEDAVGERGGETESSKRQFQNRVKRNRKKRKNKKTHRKKK